MWTLLTQCNAELNCFITIKNHKENFRNHSKVCLINQAKNELRTIRKTIRDNINNKLFEAKQSQIMEKHCQCY